MRHRSGRLTASVLPGVVVFVVVYHFDVVVLFVVMGQLSEDVSLASSRWRPRKCAQFNPKRTSMMSPQALFYTCLSTGLLTAQFN